MLKLTMPTQLGIRARLYLTFGLLLGMLLVGLIIVLVAAGASGAKPAALALFFA